MFLESFDRHGPWCPRLKVVSGLVYCLRTSLILGTITSGYLGERSTLGSCEDVSWPEPRLAGPNEQWRQPVDPRGKDVWSARDPCSPATLSHCPPSGQPHFWTGRDVFLHVNSALCYHYRAHIGPAPVRQRQLCLYLNFPVFPVTEAGAGSPGGWCHLLYCDWI
jgi:hypothetical protein